MTEQLPRWDLSDLYHGLNDPKIDLDLAKYAKDTEQFANSYQGKINAQNLAQSILDYENMQEAPGRLMSYAYLMYATNLETPDVLKFFQRVQEEDAKISSQLVFYTLEINQLSDADIEKAYDFNAQLERYRTWLESVRMFRPHMLSQEMEQYIVEKSVTGKSAWVRLFDESLSQIRCDFEGEKLPISHVINHMSDPSPERRKDAALSLAAGLKDRLSLFTLVTNTLAKDKEIDDQWRKFPHPVSSRNLSNQIEDDVVDALAQATKESYAQLSHRYYAWKAKTFGQSTIAYWDRNAPLPAIEQKVFTWNEAKDLVLKAYGDFDPAMASIAQKFFDHHWIDVPPYSGKESGAFSHGTIPEVHPYILLNFHGKARDVMTLAHELGHGIHQTLAGPQGHLLAHTPLTIAETASVFGEMLTFQALLRQAQSKAEKRMLLAQKIEDMINTVVRQVAFFEFERQVHNRRRHGELSQDDLAQIFLDTQHEALGSAVTIDPQVSCYWAYISHFIHAPFYVYAYAFGDCLVNSLYAVFEKGFPNFQQAYGDLLKAGGSKRYDALLAPFGLDAKDPQFWHQGMSMITRLIDELVSLDD